MGWDAQLFMTDYILQSPTRPVSDARITDDFIMEVFHVACCQDFNESIDSMLTEKNLPFTEAGLYDLDTFWYENLAEEVFFSLAGNLERCHDMQENWAVYNQQRQ